MKRRMLALLLAVLTLTMLTAAAFAEDTEVLGVYNVTGPLTVTNGTKDGGFYAGADTFELNCTGRPAPRGRQRRPHRRQHPVHRPDERGGRQGDIHP